MKNNNKNIKCKETINVEEIAEAKILEAYMLNSMQFVNHHDIKFNEYFNNLEIVKYINDNFDSLQFKKIKFQIINQKYTKNILNKKELFNFFEYRFEKDKFSEITHIFSNNTIMINDLIFLKKIIHRFSELKLNLKKTSVFFILKGLELIYLLIQDKFTNFLVCAKQNDEWLNFISNVKIYIEKEDIYFLDQVNEKLFKVALKINHKIEEDNIPEIIFPYGVYTFKYIIYMLIKNFNLSQELGNCFEDFMSFFENKLNSKVYKNVNFVNKETKTSEEIDALIISDKYFFLFEYKSSLLDVFDFDTEKLYIKYGQKYKRNILKKDYSLMNILNFIRNNQNYELKCDENIITEDLKNKIPVTFFITNQFWWTDISEWKFHTSPLILDYNFFDSFMCRMNFDLDVIGNFYKYYNKNIKDKNLTLKGSNINQLIMDFLYPTWWTASREENSVKKEGIFIQTDNTFLESTYQIIDLGTYFLESKNLFMLLFCVSQHAIPYLLYSLDKEITKTYSLLSTEEKAKINADSYIKNKSLTIGKFNLDTKIIFQENFVNWCKNNEFLIYILDSLRSYIV